MKTAIFSIAPEFVPLLDTLQRVIADWNTYQGFWDSPNFGEKMALIHSEISEALEADRKGLMSDHLEGFLGVEEGLADAIIHILDVAGKCDFRLGEAVTAKLLFNLTRPRKHGKLY